MSIFSKAEIESPLKLLDSSDVEANNAEKNAEEAKAEYDEKLLNDFLI